MSITAGHRFFFKKNVIREVGQLSVDAAKEINCTKGIHSFPLGAPESDEKQQPYVYPNCIEKDTLVNGTIKNFLPINLQYHRSDFHIIVDHDQKKHDSYDFRFSNNRFKSIRIIPVPSNNFSFQYSDFVAANLSICTQKNITMVDKDMFRGYSSKLVRVGLDGRRSAYINSSRAMLEKVCTFHKESSWDNSAIYGNDMDNCLTVETTRYANEKK